MTKAQLIELMNNGDWETESGHELFPGEQAGDKCSVSAWAESKLGDIQVMFTLSFSSYEFGSEDEMYNEEEDVEVSGVQIVDTDGDTEYLYEDDLPAWLKDVGLGCVFYAGKESYKAALKAFEEEDRDEIIGFEYQQSYHTMTMGFPHQHTGERNIAGTLHKFDSEEERDAWIEQAPAHWDREAKTFQQARKLRKAMDTSDFEDHVEKMSCTKVDLECEY